MTPITSPTSKEHLRRLAIFLVLCLGMGAWFIYDVRVRYPRANVEELAGMFDPVPPPEKVGSLKDQIDRAISPLSKQRIVVGDTLEAVEEKLGKPTYIDQGDSGAYHYLGPGGLLTIRRSGNKVTSVDWTNAGHTPADLTWQWVFAGICGVLALAVAVRLWLALRIRVVLSDAGLSPTPGRVISWEQMRGLRTDRYREKGWVDLQYDSDGVTKEVRLDSYKIREFRSLISTLCERKGFANPLAGAGSGSPGAAGQQNEFSSN